MWDLDPVTIGKSATVFYIKYGPLLAASAIHVE